MPTVIHVVGVSNSGKSGSIRLFLSDRGLHFPASPRDVTLVTPIPKSRIWVIGIGSGGDDANVVNDNFALFLPHNCDFIVCASKSRGAAYNAVMSHVQRLGAQHVMVHTQQQSSAVAQQADNRRVADEIWRHIP